MQTRRFLVTGGSQGIGAAIVALARKAGHDVVFTGRNERLIQQVAQETGAHALRADVSAGADNARTIEFCQQRMGGIDVLINNAAFGYNAEIGAQALGPFIDQWFSPEAMARKRALTESMR